MLRGHRLVNGRWGQINADEEDDERTLALTRISARVQLARHHAISRNDPRKGFRLSNKDWARLLQCGARNVQRIVAVLEVTGDWEVRRGGGRFTETNWYRLCPNPGPVPKGLTVRNAEKWLANLGGEELPSAGPAADDDAAAEAAPSPPPAAPAPASSPAAPAAEGGPTPGRFGAAIDEAAAWVCPPAPAPPPELMARLAADAYFGPMVAVPVDAGGPSNDYLWTILEGNFNARRPPPPPPPNVWNLAEQLAAARAGGSLPRAARELVVAFHEVGLGRVDPQVVHTELVLATQLLERHPSTAWSILAAAVPLYKARMQAYKKPPDRAQHLTFIVQDLRKAGADLPGPNES